MNRSSQPVTNPYLTVKKQKGKSAVLNPYKVCRNAVNDHKDSNSTNHGCERIMHDEEVKVVKNHSNTGSLAPVNSEGHTNGCQNVKRSNGIVQQEYIKAKNPYILSRSMKMKSMVTKVKNPYKVQTKIRPSAQNVSSEQRREPDRSECIVNKTRAIKRDIGTEGTERVNKLKVLKSEDSLIIATGKSQAMSIQNRNTIHELEMQKTTKQNRAEVSYQKKIENNHNFPRGSDIKQILSTAKMPSLVEVKGQDKAEAIINAAQVNKDHSLETKPHNHYPLNTHLSTVVASNKSIHDVKRSYSATGTEISLPEPLIYDEDRTRNIKDQYRLTLIKNADLSGTLKNGWKLLQHQKIGVLLALQMRKILLAYDMGLGKTLIGCVFAKAFKKTFPQLKVYIISPVSLKKEWERTASDVTGLECEPDKSPKMQLNQDSLDVRITSWAKVPLRVPPHIQHYIVICDEAHNLQSMESGRTKDTLKLTHGERCVGVLLLTGTPMKNGKPANLFPLLRAVGHPFGDDQRLYEAYFCNGQHKTFGGRTVWDASGSSNLGLLNCHIKSHVVYKTKEECLMLPEKKREFRTVPVGSKFEIQHNRALADLAAVFKASKSKYHKDESGEAVLGAFARVRQVAAYAKIDATVSLAKSILEEEPSIVIFTYFVQVAKEVHRKLESHGWNGEFLSGETPSSKRQAMVDNFQAGISPVFCCTFGAGGVGITLTAARTIILMDRPWTPGDALQAEDRVRRIGQTKSVRSIWLRCFECDTQIDNLLDSKNDNATSVVSSDTQSNEHKAAPKISIKSLVETIVKDVGSTRSSVRTK
mmetsp:Transcript_22601/g.34453  ORF Transcript_22601/g.34453 Transcript_22601/m.34453 type:complete len:813 (+) Transcript_22601:174-2612(+)